MRLAITTASILRFTLHHGCHSPYPIASFHFFWMARNSCPSFMALMRIIMSPNSRARLSFPCVAMMPATSTRPSAPSTT